MIKIQRNVMYTIDGEDADVLGDICEIVRVLLEVDRVSDRFSYIESIKNGKVRDFIHKIFDA